MTPLLFDTHAHLTMLTHDSTESILERARQAGVGHLVTVSTELDNFKANQGVATKYPNVFFSLGVHPHEREKWVGWKPHLLSFFIKDKVPAKCVAIGEIGLDFHYNHAPKEFQMDAFRAQLLIAKRYDLPVIIHCRNAFTELFGIIKELGLPSKGGVMHCFTGGPPEAFGALDLGLHISFSGILTFKNAVELQNAAVKIPKDKILVETDCPYLAPVPYRGKPNEPAYLIETAKFLATLRGDSFESISETVFQNACKFFHIGS